MNLDTPQNLYRFSPDVETALFRVVQQSLANIRRHSESRVAHIRLALATNRLTVEISDEGRGLAKSCPNSARAANFPVSAFPECANA